MTAQEAVAFLASKRNTVKFQQRYQKRHGSLFKPLCAKVLCVRVTPDCRPDSSSQFWELDSHWIPHGCRGDMLPQHHRAVGDYLQERPDCPESPLDEWLRQEVYRPWLPHDWSRSLHHELKKARTESVQGTLCRRNFLCRFSYLCWNLTDIFLELAARRSQRRAPSSRYAIPNATANVNSHPRPSTDRRRCGPLFR